MVTQWAVVVAVGPAFTLFALATLRGGPLLTEQAHPSASVPEQHPKLTSLNPEVLPDPTIPSFVVKANSGVMATIKPAPSPPYERRPMGLIIENIAVDVAIERLSIGANGELQMPKDPSEVGWWQAPHVSGPIVVVGHVDSYTGPAAFFRVRALEPGDPIKLAFDDGASRQYAVTRVEQVRKTAFPTKDVYQSDPNGIRLVTCGGRFDRKTGHYDDNFIVYAMPVSKNIDSRGAILF